MEKLVRSLYPDLTQTKVGSRRDALFALISAPFLVLGIILSCKSCAELGHGP